MREFRKLRAFETAPDAYVEFSERQRQWSRSISYPLAWRVYQATARLRCIILGHEWSPCWEEEKFDLSRLGHTSTHCVFCAKAKP